MPRWIFRSLLTALLPLVAAGLILGLAACSKKPNPPPTPVPMDLTQAQPGNPLAPGGEAALPPGGQAAQANPKCRSICKATCTRGRQCNLPGYNNVLRCGRLCLAVCSRGLIPDNLENCMRPENDCTQVGKCLTELRATLLKHIQEMKAKRAAGQQGGAPPAPPPAGGQAPPPADAPAE